MSFKTISIVTITVIITVFLMLNTDSVTFNLIFATKSVSKLLVVGICFLCGFLVGIMAARPRKNKIEKSTNLNTSAHSQTILSSEDDEYLSHD